MAADCLFCRIVAGEIPATKVREDDVLVVFLDIHPVNFGHLLIVPKSHHPSLALMPDDLAMAVARWVPRLTRAVLAATKAQGLNLVVNNGEVAGQTIDHVHWHLIPRFKGDAVHWPWPHLTYPEGAAIALRDQMVARLED